MLGSISIVIFLDHGIGILLQKCAMLGSISI